MNPSLLRFDRGEYLQLPSRITLPLTKAPESRAYRECMAYGVKD